MPRRAAGGLGTAPHVRSTVTMFVLVALLALGSWYGWRTLTAEPEPEPLLAACPIPDPQPDAPQVTPQEVSLNVYNATLRDRLASRTADDLRRRGFVVLATGNDPLEKRIPEPAEVRSAQQQQHAAALVAAQVPGAKIVFDERTDGTVDLVLGEGFLGVATPASDPPPTADPTAPPAPAGTPAPAPEATPGPPACQSVSPSDGGDAG